MTVEIKRIGKGDEALLARVAPEVFDQPVDAERLAAYIGEPGHILLVALANGEVVAQCAAVIHRHPDKPTELYIDEVGVTPVFQRRGLASRMLSEMFAIGRSLGCEESWVGTEDDNLAARALYKSQGADAERFVMYVYKL